MKKSVVVSIKNTKGQTAVVTVKAEDEMRAMIFAIDKVSSENKDFYFKRRFNVLFDWERFFAENDELTIADIAKEAGIAEYSFKEAKEVCIGLQVSEFFRISSYEEAQKFAAALKKLEEEFSAYLSANQNLWLNQFDDIYDGGFDDKEIPTSF